nr:hypothetical protein Iba_chr09dCG12270 [Ipomoea batatas]
MDEGDPPLDPPENPDKIVHHFLKDLRRADYTALLPEISLVTGDQPVAVSQSRTSVWLDHNPTWENALFPNSNSPRLIDRPLSSSQIPILLFVLFAKSNQMFDGEGPTLFVFCEAGGERESPAVSVLGSVAINCSGLTTAGMTGA